MLRYVLVLNSPGYRVSSLRTFNTIIDAYIEVAVAAHAGMDQVEEFS